MIDKDIGNGECESCLRKFSNVSLKEEEELEFKASSKKMVFGSSFKEANGACQI